MNLRSGFPYWLIKDGLPFEYPKLEKNLRTDIIILGGGISGALAAHYLIKAGIDCAVVDARSIGLGSTCASTSLLQYEIDTPLVKLSTLVGIKHALRAYKLSGDAIIKLGKIAELIGLEEFHFKKSLHYAAARKDIDSLREEFALRRKNGFAVEFMDEKSIKNEYGFSAPGGIRSELAADTDIYMFTHLLHQYNIRKGLKVYDRTNIQSIVHNKTDVQLKSADGFVIRAKKLIYATGYESMNTIPKNLLKLQSTYAIISESISEKNPLWKDESILWNTADPYLYMRTTPTRRIIVGGRDEMFYSPAKRDKLILSKSRQLQKDFIKLFPDIPFHMEFGWTGTYGSTKDGLPFIGNYPKLPNSYFALGFGGNGITFSQIAAEIIVDLVKGRKNKDVDIFGFDRTY